MRGIFVLSFHKQPGAFVDREFPENITKQLGINKTEQNKIYSLHRMRNTRPNFLFVKVKKHQIASFYSGFDYKQYVGRPNQCISIILSEGENPTKWEGELKRLTHDLLPILNEIRGDEVIMDGLSDHPRYKKFDKILEENFEELRQGNIVPMGEDDGEYKEGDGAVIQKISTLNSERTLANEILKAEDIAKATEAAKNSGEVTSTHTNQTQPQTSETENPLSAITKQMEMMEVESLRDEVRNLHAMIADKNNQIKSLQTQINEIKEVGISENEDLSKIKGEYEALIASKEQELETWTSKVSELNEELFIKQDNLKKTTEMMMQMTMDQQAQAERMRELRSKIKKLESTQSVPDDVAESDLNNLREHIADLEEQLKDLSTDLEKSKERNKKIFMENKENESIIDKLQEENESLKKDNDEIQKERDELNSKMEGFFAKVGQLEEELVHSKRKIKMQRREIMQLKKGIIPQSQSERDKPAISSEQIEEYHEKIDKLQLKNRDLEVKLSNAQSQTTISNDSPSTGSNRVLNEKLKMQDRQLENMETELVKAKKTIKVQGREISHLKNVLDLE